MKTFKKNTMTKNSLLLTSSSLLLGSAAMISPLAAEAGMSTPIAQVAPFICTSSAQQASCTLTLKFLGSAPGEPAIQLVAAKANVVSVSGGYHLTSDVGIKTPTGDLIPLANADIQINMDASGVYVKNFTGTADVGFLKTGFMKNANLHAGASASIGMDIGANLTSLGAHLNPGRSYLYVTAQEGVSGNLGPVTVSTPGSASGSIVIDPSDPFIYLGGSILNVKDKISLTVCDKTTADCSASRNDFGFGLSLTGQIPFAYDTTLPFANDLADMKGQIVIDGTFPLGDLPLSVSGSAVLNIDGDNDGVTIMDAATSPDVLTDPKAYDSKLAASGDLDVSIPFLKKFNVNFKLGDGTVFIKDSQAEKLVDFNGVQYGGNSSLPVISDYLPITTRAGVNVTGHFLIDTSNVASPDGWQKALESMKESYVIMSGDMAYDAGNLGKWAHLDLGRLEVAHGSLKADKNGFLLTGTAGFDLPIPYVKFTDQNTIRLNIPSGNLASSQLNIAGNMQVANVDIANGQVSVNSNGAMLTGQINSYIGNINLSGSVDNAGVNLTGHSDVFIPASKFSDLLDPGIKKANDDLNKALSDVNNLNSQLSNIRATVQSEHDKISAQFAKANADVTIAQNKVFTLQNQINGFYAQINRYQNEINNWKSWYHNLPWYKKSYSWAQLSYEVSWRGTAIAGLYASIGGVEIAKSTANAALTLARKTLAGINTAVLNTPIDADPRVVAILGSQKIAQAALDAAKLVVNNLPRPGDYNGSSSLTLNNNGLGGTVKGTYTFKVGGHQTSVAVSGRLVIQNNKFSACLDIPNAQNFCIAL